MDETFINNIENRILDFATDKRNIWEKKHQIYSVIFEITPKCNFKCVHCYLNNHHLSKEISYERIIEIIDITYEKGVLFLTLTGGDIFTRADFMDIYMYAKNKGFIIELYTNGSLINDAHIKLFEKYPPLLIDISLYGSCEDTYYRVTGVTGMYNRVISNIKKLLKAGIRVSIKAPVLSVYFNELPKIKAIAEDFKIPFRTGFEIFPTIDNDKSVQNYSVSIVEALKYEFEEFDKRPRTFGSEYEVELVNLKKQRPLFRCKLGRASCVIDYEGKMCPCMSFRHIGKKLTRDNFDEIWNNFGKFPGMKASEDYKCLECEAYDFCDICPAMMQFVYGDLEYVDTHFCKRAQARYKYYIEHKCMEEIIDGLK